MKPEQIKKAREAKGLSQFDLADKTGISRYNISLLENGNREIKDDVELKNLIKALKGTK